MNNVINIEKQAEVREVEMVVEAKERDPFVGTLVQPGVLPFTFYYGKRRTLRHTCCQCGQKVEAEFAYGKQMIGLGTLSRQDFNENRDQLDIIGRLFNQYLDHEVDVNGFESYMYISDPDPNRGALLNVSYYRCSSCQAQYLVLYQRQLKDERPPFEPDEIRIKSVYQVTFDHAGLLRVLDLSTPAAAA